MSQRKSLQIQQDDKFFTRLLSKESSMANPSSRLLYYADRPSSVPFLWESQPGTPKESSFCHDHIDDHDDEFSHFRIPPLTPPPSFYFKPKFVQKFDHMINAKNDHNNDRRNDPNYCHKRSRSSHLLSSIFPKKFKIIIGLKFKAGHWISSSSSMNERSTTPTTTTAATSMHDATTFRSASTTTTSWFSSSSSSFDSRGDEEDHDVGGDNGNNEDGSPTSTLCFGCYRGHC